MSAISSYDALNPPFDNPKVRKALNMAINKEAILDAVFQGAGKIAKNPIPPTMWSYDDVAEMIPTIPTAPRRCSRKPASRI